jgi:hypothetical protein
MSVEIGFWGIGILLLLLVLRVPVALALIAVSFGGIAWLLGLHTRARHPGEHALQLRRQLDDERGADVPADGLRRLPRQLTAGLFDAAKAAPARLPGALAIASIFACSGFAAVCGSSLATAASMGRIAIPEMVRAGYAPSASPPAPSPPAARSAR